MTDFLPEAEILYIEAQERRWHGQTLVDVRWEPYKPDGQRQMKAKGRWQRQVWNGDFFAWENIGRPVGLIKPEGA